MVKPDNRISIGWMTNTQTDLAEIAAASALWREIRFDSTKSAALRDILLSARPGLPLEASGMVMDLPASTFAERPLTAWKLAMAEFHRTNKFEAHFRDTVFNPADEYSAASGPIGEAADELMDAANDATDQARHIVLRTPAPDGAALRWKLEQFFVEKVMPFPPHGVIEQVFADFDRLLAAGAGSAAQAGRADQDAALRASWSLWKAMREAYEAEPVLDCSQEEINLIEAPYWEAIGTVEQAIANARATTPEGLAIKIKIALDEIIPGRACSNAIRHGRFDEVETHELDRHQNLLLDLLRDLPAMSDRLGEL